MRAAWIALSILAACGGDDAPIDVPRPDAASASLSFDDGTAFDVVLGGPGALVTGDVDADGDVDLVFGFGPKVTVLLGDGAGGFTAQPAIDLDHDDVVDVALRDATLSLAVRREFDSVVLDYPDVTYTDARPISAVAAGDGWLAVHHLDAIAIAGGGEVALPGVETFAGVAVADLDGDATVLINDPNAPGTFVEAAVLGETGGDLAIADIDGDTRPDVVVAGTSQLWVFRQP